MDDHVQNGAPVFVASTVNPEVHYTSPVSAHPQTYVIHQQQQPQSSSDKCRSSVAGKIAAIWLGAILVASGAMSFAGASVASSFFATLSYIGYGVWCGSMFVAAGSVAIAAGHHETKKQIIGTAVTSGIAVAAAITQLSLALVALERDDYFECDTWCNTYPSYACPCYYDNWEYKAQAGDITLITAAVMALIAGIWLFIVGCLAVCRKPASFQKHSAPVQGLHHQQQQMTMGQPLSNVYYPTPTSQKHSTQVQGLHHHQQLMPVSQQLSNTSYPPSSSQVVQMQVPNNLIAPQTLTTSTIPNQQVLQVPVQLILTVSMPTLSQESQSQQMNAMPVQYVQIQQQQMIPVNEQHPNTTAPPASSQEYENHGFPRDDDLDVNRL